MKVIVNFFWFLWRLFKNRDQEDLIVDDKIKEERYDICMNCIKLDNKGILSKIKGPRCGICGCFIQYKVLYSFEQCPNSPPKWEHT